MFFKEIETDGATVLVAGHLGSTSTCPGLPEAPLHALSALGSHLPPTRGRPPRHVGATPPSGELLCLQSQGAFGSGSCPGHADDRLNSAEAEAWMHLRGGN